MRKLSFLVIVMLLISIFAVGCKKAPEENEAKPIDVQNNDIPTNVEEKIQESETETTDNEYFRNDDIQDDTIDSIVDKEQPQNGKVYELTDGDTVSAGINNLSKHMSDIFTARIVKKAQVDKKVSFPNFKNEYATPVLYTVSITGTITNGTVSNYGDIIQIIHYENNEEKGNLRFPKLEIGKEYLIAGVVQPYENKAVIVDSGVITSLLKQDRTLVPITYSAETLLKEILNYDVFVSDKSIAEINKAKVGYIPYCFYQLATPEDNKVSVNGIEKAEITSLSDKQRAEVIDILKEAVKVYSKVTIDLGTDEK